MNTLIIGGTNGKGSTTLFLSSALVHSGRRVCTYLSPHLQCPTERLLYNLSPIALDELNALAIQHEDTAKRFCLTYFEFLTLLALVWAKRVDAEFLILEVGLGGRLDATNVTNPLASALTNVALDHQEYLGSTLVEILEEKMAIFREEGLTFTGIQEPEFLKRVEHRCEKLDAIYYFSKELASKQLRVDWSGQEILVHGVHFSLNCPSLSSIQNAKLAYLMARIVFPKISIPLLQQAFSAVCLPGKLELVQSSPNVLLSSAHNPAAISDLIASLELVDRDQLHVLCAFSPNKDFRQMYQKLAKSADSIQLTQIPLLEDTLPKGYREMGPFEPNPHKALEELVNRAARDDVILVTGSTYLVGEVRKSWGKRVSFLEAPSKVLPRSSPAPDETIGARAHKMATRQSPVQEV